MMVKNKRLVDLIRYWCYSRDCPWQWLIKQPIYGRHTGVMFTNRHAMAVIVRDNALLGCLCLDTSM